VVGELDLNQAQALLHQRRRHHLHLSALLSQSLTFVKISLDASGTVFVNPVVVELNLNQAQALLHQRHRRRHLSALALKRQIASMLDALGARDCAYHFKGYLLSSWGLQNSRSMIRRRW